ncbi:MAG: DNA repair protein RecO [Gemmatimonadetes bacterium]|nr:MAG: DNA repair protein RecO [Gemmatimonadota bacterium]
MSLVATPAVVLRTYRYSETSKVVRLATRDCGVQSAIAKGALRPRSPFGAGLELLSEGVAQLYLRDGRELQTLAGFDVANLRRELALDLGRFAGATALAEIVLRMAPAASHPGAYDALVAGLDSLVATGIAAADAAGIRALWRLLAVLGFEPSLRGCVRDDTPVDADHAVTFSAAEGGVLCERCAAERPEAAQTRLAARDYRDLLVLNDPTAPLPALDAKHAAAHRRLVARFVRHHSGEADRFPALELWERHSWAPLSPPQPVAS